MRIKAIFALAALAAGALLGTAASGDDVAALIAGIQGRYGKAKDLTIDFEQTATVKQMGAREQKSNGVIYFAKPNKMRWVYKSAPAKEIITDGRSLVIYYVEDAKAYLRKSGEEFDVGLPMAVLAGNVDVKTQWNPEMLADEDGRARLKLTPKKPMTFAYMILSVNRHTFLVERLDTFDAYGNVTKIALKNPRFNTKLPEGTFTFVPKEGVEIVDMPSSGID